MDAILWPILGHWHLTPFAGYRDWRWATTGGIELNPEYVELARRRITDDCPLLNIERQESMARKLFGAGCALIIFGVLFVAVAMCAAVAVGA